IFRRRRALRLERRSYVHFPLEPCGSFVADRGGSRPVVKPERSVVRRARVIRTARRCRRGSLAFGGLSPVASPKPPDFRDRRARSVAVRGASGGTSEIDVAEGFDGVASEAAARYAQAVFDLAKEAKALEAV